MAIDCFAHKLSAVTFGGTAHAGPLTFSIQETVTWNESFAGGRVVPKRALDSVQGIASVTFQGLRDFVAKTLTSGAFVATMTDNAASPATVTVTAADMVPNDNGVIGGNGPAEQTASYVYMPSSGSDTTWVTVSS